MKKISQIIYFIKSFSSRVYSGFDIRILFFFGGLSITGYGIYLNFSLGTSLIFVGTVLMVVGWILGDSK